MYHFGDIVITADDMIAEVQGYTSRKCGIVVLKGENGRQFSAHENTLNPAPGA